MDDTWVPKENSELSFSNFDDFGESLSEPRNHLSKSLGPKELRTIMQSLKLEQQNQSLSQSKSKKSKKLAWIDEIDTFDRFRTRSDARFELSSKADPGKSKSLKKSPLAEGSRIKETTSIFVQDRTATFVNRLGEKECSTSQINQYHIIREIGSGAYGTVYLCKSALSGQYFALKMISKSRLVKKMRWKAVMNGPGQHDVLEEMRKEIAVLKKLSRHPNINYLVEVLDNAADDNIYMSRLIYDFIF
jgi:hypothetical protein